MKIYLIRHGETVDNVAGIYAGVRDSQLTNYGVDQTKRLGEYFASQDVIFTHIFASPLTRAYQTAEAVHKYQAEACQLRHVNHIVPDIVKVQELIEQNFGYYEGKPFYTRSPPGKGGRDSHAQQHRDDSGFVDVESKESMGRRADVFLETHLLPLLTDFSGSELAIAIVSHGMLLSTLWRRMLRRMPRESVTVAPEVTAVRGPIVLEHLGGWTNTGYLELDLQKTVQPVRLQPESGEGQEQAVSLPAPSNAVDHGTTPDSGVNASSLPFDGYRVMIASIDNRTHLVGLKRQRGGIGRLAHDASQRKLDSFFKKPSIG